MAACVEVKPSRILSVANDTTRIEFAHDTPTAIIEPINAWTLNVVSVKYNIHKIPDNANGTGVMIINGFLQDWKFTTISRYTRINDNNNPDIRDVNA